MIMHECCCFGLDTFNECRCWNCDTSLFALKIPPTLSHSSMMMADSVRGCSRHLTVATARYFNQFTQTSKLEFARRKMEDNQQSWESIVSKKRSARNQLLVPYLVNDISGREPRVHSVEVRSQLDDEVQRITDVDNIPSLLSNIESGKFTAEQVVRAYIKRYGIPPTLWLCWTDIL